MPTSRSATSRYRHNRNMHMLLYPTDYLEMSDEQVIEVDSKTVTKRKKKFEVEVSFSKLVTRKP